MLVTLPAVEVMATGTWRLSSGEATFTDADLATAVEAAQCPALSAPPLKLGHHDPRFDGEPAVGHLDNLRAEGTKLVADLADVPGWLAEICASAFPNRSIEAYRAYQCSLGHVHDFAITAMALLGVTPPGIGTLKSLDDVKALYGLAAAKGPAGTGQRLEYFMATARKQPARKISAEAAEELIQASIARGAFTSERAEIYREWLADGGDPEIIENLESGYRSPEEIRAAGGAPVTAAGAGSDLIAELRSTHPALVAAAYGEDPNPPRVFGSSNVPPFTASGIDPAVLRRFPWQLRRPMAYAATRADALAISETDPIDLAKMAQHPANADYVAAVKAWATGHGQQLGDDVAAIDQVDRELFGQADSLRKGRP
jgi:hypothetical protein